MRDMKTRRGLEKLQEIEIQWVLGESKSIPPKSTREGFLAFTVPNSKATKLNLSLVLEKEPEKGTSSYERVKFEYKYIQDLVLRARQPAVRR